MPKIKALLAVAVSSLAASCLIAGIAAAQEDAVVLEPTVIRDRQASAANRDAISLLKPRDWKIEGGIKWYPDHAHQACCEVRITSPRGLEQVETLPYKAHIWRQTWVARFPDAGNYLGHEVQQAPSDPRDYVAKHVVPKHRPGAAIVGHRDLPALARAAGEGMRAGRTRIEYRVGDRDVEEDIYVFYSVVSVNHPEAGLTAFWGPDRVFGLRAAKGKLDERTDLLLSIMNSAKIHPGWFSEYSFVCELF